MNIPKTYNEFEKLSDDEILKLSWMDLNIQDRKKLLDFLKIGIIKEKIGNVVNENNIKNFSLSDIIYEVSKK